METLKFPNEKWANCGCRDWLYLPDKDFKEKQSDKDVLIHECERVKVYQVRGSLSRVFIKQNN